MKGITLRQLAEESAKLVRKGLGNKTILIPTDDEGNGFHTLYYGFTTDPDNLTSLSDLFHDNNDPKEVIILG